MGLDTKDDMKVYRQNKPFARNNGSTHGATKQDPNHRIKEKSADRASLRWNLQIASCQKDVEALLVSVQRAWEAAERMRAAIEEHDPETRESEEGPSNDVF